MTLNRRMAGSSWEARTHAQAAGQSSTFRAGRFPACPRGGRSSRERRLRTRSRRRSSGRRSVARTPRPSARRWQVWTQVTSLAPYRSYPVLLLVVPESESWSSCVLQVCTLMLTLAFILTQAVTPCTILSKGPNSGRQCSLPCVSCCFIRAHCLYALRAGLAPRLFKAHWSLAPLPQATTTPAAPLTAAQAPTSSKAASPSRENGQGPTSGQTACSVYVSCTTGGASYLTPSGTPDTFARALAAGVVAVPHLSVARPPLQSSNPLMSCHPVVGMVVPMSVYNLYRRWCNRSNTSLILVSLCMKDFADKLFWCLSRPLCMPCG